MTDRTNDADAETEYRGPDVPAPIGENLEAVLDLPERPETFGDWAEAMADVVDRARIDVDPDALCTTEASPHRASFDGETQHYRCTQDAFAVPFLVDDVDAVDIRTESPVRGEIVSITVTESDVEVDPTDAVLSFGVAAAVEPPEGDVPRPARAYAQICPYGNAFVSTAEYEEWADDVDAHTMTISVDDALELGRALGRAGTGRSR